MVPTLLDDIPDAARPPVAAGDDAASQIAAAAAAALGDVMRRTAIARAAIDADPARARELVADVHRTATAALARLRERLAPLLAVADADQRALIAADVHDALGEGFSVAVMLAGGAAAALPGDPEAARGALDQLTTAIAETRGDLLAALGAGRRSLCAVALVERARAAGQDVRLRGDEPTLDGLAPELSTSAYRILQEALTNARKHAPGAPATVTLRRGPDALHVHVTNPLHAVAGSTGRRGGLAGMRCRARHHGGDVSAGPGPGGVFAVRASLPLDRAA